MRQKGAFLQMNKCKPQKILYAQETGKEVFVAYEYLTTEDKPFKSTKDLRHELQWNNVNVNAIVFCPHCFTGSREQQWKFTWKKRARKQVGKCPHCGNFIEFEGCKEDTVIDATNHYAENPPYTFTYISSKTFRAFPRELEW